MPVSPPDRDWVLLIFVGALASALAIGLGLVGAGASAWPARGAKGRSPAARRLPVQHPRRQPVRPRPQAWFSPPSLRTPGTPAPSATFRFIPARPALAIPQLMVAVGGSTPTRPRWPTIIRPER